MAVVKANAYGHDLAVITRILHESKTNNSRMWYGVDNLDEARIVLAIVPTAKVLILGYTQNERLKEAAKLGARLTVYNWETVRALQKFFGVASESSRRRTLSGATPLRVHMKVETGTTRQGIAESDVVEYVKTLKKLRGVTVEGISTHFADSEDIASDYAIQQLERYNSVIKRLHGAGLDVPVQHAACTAATLRLPQTHGNLVRIGIGMYGLWPSEDMRTHMQNVVRPFKVALGDAKASHYTGNIDLRPVLTWKTIVAQVKKVKKGTPVGYDLTERVECNSKIVVLPIGYFDGYDRGLSKIGYVLIGGKRCKIVGRVCMNMCMADITDVGHIKPEDEVVLLGAQGREAISADEIAKQLGTINYEVITRISGQLPRVVI